MLRERLKKWQKDKKKKTPKNKKQTKLLGSEWASLVTLPFSHLNPGPADKDKGGAIEVQLSP